MSDWSNLNFSGDWDVQTFKAKCEDQRKIANRWPAYDPRMGTVEEYQWFMGPWHLTFMLETWTKRPMWHGSAACIVQVGTRTVKMGKFKVEEPRDDFLDIRRWEPEHYEQARFILAEVFGPIIRPNDDNQRVQERTGAWGLHHYVLYEGPKFWLKHQN